MALDRSPDLPDVRPVKSNLCVHHSHCSPWLLSLAYRLGQHLVLPLFFGRITIEGQEHLPQTGPVILAPTHKSRWDGIMVPYVAGRLVTGRDLRYMVSVNEMSGLQGWLLRRLGGFPINPTRPSIASFRHVIDLLNQGEMVVIFPEGGIYRDTQIHALKPGFARLALQSQADQPDRPVQVVPIAISYSQARPTWGCDVTIKIGVPLNVATYDQAHSKQSAQRLTQDVAIALEGLAHSHLSPAWAAPRPETSACR